MKVRVIPPGVTGDDLRREIRGPRNRRGIAMRKARKRASMISARRKIEERLIREAHERLA